MRPAARKRLIRLCNAAALCSAVWAIAQLAAPTEPAAAGPVTVAAELALATDTTLRRAGLRLVDAVCQPDNRTRRRWPAALGHTRKSLIQLNFMRK